MPELPDRSVRSAAPQAAARGNAARRRTPAAVMRAGLATLVFSVLLALTPLVLGRWDLNRYLVAFGFVGGCVGASILLHGFWDWLRGGDMVADAGGERPPHDP